MSKNQLMRFLRSGDLTSDEQRQLYAVLTDDAEQHSKACKLLAAAHPLLPADAEILSNDVAIWLAANL